MKKLCVILSLLILLSLFPDTHAAAADGNYAVGYMHYTIANGMATITKCDPLLEGELVVPAELSGCPVVAIGDAAFAKSRLTKIILPESIHTLGRAAFLGASVREVLGAEHIQSFGDYAFAFSALQAICLPPDMTELPDGLFMCASFNEQVRFLLPDTITRIGDFAFYNITSGFAELSLPSSLREIGDAAFAGTSPKNWKTLTLPEGLVSIGDGSFWRTLTIESLSLPSTLQRCGSGKIAAFFGTNLETVSLSEGITSLPNAMFLECPNLKSVLLPDSLTVLSADEFGLPNSLLAGHSYPSHFTLWTNWDETDSFTGGEIVPHRFDEMQQNPHLFLYANPESFGTSFAAQHHLPVSPKEAYALTNTQYENDFAYRIYGGRAEIVGYTGAAQTLSVPATLGGYPVFAIGAYALRANDTLTTLVLPASLCEIRAGAVSDCTALESITLAGESMVIEYAAFNRCKKLAEIIGFERAISVGEFCFSGCAALTALPALSPAITELPDDFASNAGLKHVALPSHIRKIGSSAFYGCDGLETLTLPETLEHIGASAFANCKALRAVTIPNRVTTLGTEAFHGCDALRYVKVGKGVTSLDYGIFTFCPSLETVILPDSLSFIYEYEFYDGFYSRFMRRSFIERPKTLTIFANQDSYAADFANRHYIPRMPLIRVLYEDTPIMFDALPVIREGRTLVPFRAIFEALGAAVQWEPETQTVTATQDVITLRLQIGEPLLYKNNIPIPMDSAAALMQDRTFVPLRAVSEALDYLVTWEDSTKTATISPKGK